MKDQPFNSEIVEFDGCRVRIEYYYDHDADPPWDMSDGHGPVRRAKRLHNEHGSDKRPGERPLSQPDRNEAQYYYDWAAAIKLAKRDGWNAEPFDAPNRVERAVQSDFDFLSGWVNNDWCYVGVVCTVVDEDGDEVRCPNEPHTDSCWGFETYKDYHLTAGRELADELAKAYLGRVLEMSGEPAW